MSANLSLIHTHLQLNTFQMELEIIVLFYDIDTRMHKSHV
jgi:hypothetical protein